MPAKIASGVSNNTIVIIEEKNSDLPASRWLQNQNAIIRTEIPLPMCSIPGPISESDKADYVDQKGYKPNRYDRPGGIEKAFESTLKGQDGTKKRRSQRIWRAGSRDQ
jgi:cell division protein FtsI/penicillin-binding protein 2